MTKDLTSYDLSRMWFDWAFENPDLISPNHAALYFFCIEHCNRLGWKSKFGLPTNMAKDAIGIKNYKTYINTLSDLSNWGFIIWVEKSKNQYSSNIIELVKNTKATTKAYTKALLTHSTKQVQSNYQSIDSIDKPNNLITIKPNNLITEIDNELLNSYSMIENIGIELKLTKDKVIENLKIFIQMQKSENNYEGRELSDLQKHFPRWLRKQDLKTKNIQPQTKGTGGVSFA